MLAEDALWSVAWEATPHPPPGPQAAGCALCSEHFLEQDWATLPVSPLLRTSRERHLCRHLQHLEWAQGLATSGQRRSTDAARGIWAVLRGTRGG